ncbi:hypothetical protein V8F06_005422 [Rhypophila decipiens]
MMLLVYITVCLFCFASAEVTILRWKRPEEIIGLMKRQDGYSPDYKSCGVGHDCSSCGDTFEQCSAPVDVAVFCYEPSTGQKCCPNGQGKACDSGFYCAMNSNKHTWCCPESLTVQQCASLHGVPAL